MLTALAGCAGDTQHNSGPPVVHPEPASSAQVPVQPERTTVPEAVPAQTGGVERTPGGVVTRDLTVGAGAPIPAGAVAEVSFVAMLANGEVFDSTEKRKRTLTFDLASAGLIQGLREGIPGMRPGGKRRIEIPWRLAYGEQGREPIPPRTDLIFEIELVRWDPPARGAY